MSQGSETGAWSGDESEISLLDLISIVLKRWKLVVALPIAAAVVAAVISLLLPAKFEAAAQFVPETDQSSSSLPSGLAGLAAQFGVAVPSGGGSSPAFYAKVLESRTLRDQILGASFSNPRGGTAGDSLRLIDMIDVEGDSEEELLEEGRKKLAQATTVRTFTETGIVSVSVETRHAVLSADVANYFIELLNTFNTETRRSSAQERREFVEERLSEAQDELWEAEEVLKDFLERNRQYQGSPDLRFQYERLERQVTIKQEVLTSLRRQYEEARIQQVNDTEVITVIDWAVPPQKRSSPKRKVIVIVTFFAAMVLGVLGSFGAEFSERARTSDQEDMKELVSRWDSIKREIRSIVTRRRGE
jgi:uncharacterized protein involved in exopolysaccharide biosynthesis